MADEPRMCSRRGRRRKLNKPAPVLDAMFDDLDNNRYSAFGDFFDALRGFLNELPCLQDLQTIRATRLPSHKTQSSKAFTRSPRLDDSHWYTYHDGGATEMQFNVGMYGQRGVGQPPPYFRIGVGWAFYYSRPAAEASFRRFLSLLTQDAVILNQFSIFMSANNLGIEYYPRIYGRPGLIPTQQAAAWLRQVPDTRDWIFMGRLLRRGIDRQTLEDPDLLGEVFRSVLCGFKPIWVRVG